MMRIDINAEGMEELLAGIRSQGERAVIAANRAVGKTVDQTVTAIASELGAASRVPVGLLKRHRIYSLKPSGKRLRGRVWVGFAPVKAAYVGTLSKTAKGARAGQHSFPGSFIARMQSGHRGVFHRTGFDRKIQEDVVEIKGITASVNRDAAQRLRQNVIQELNYELNVR